MSTPPPPPGENDLIEVIAGLTAVRSGVTIGIGDDAAVLATDPATVVTQDLLVDGVHFRRSTASLTDIGHKAVAVNLSDLAAMGATPTAVFVGLGLPDIDPLDAGDIAELYAGMDALVAIHGATIAGGDIVRAPALLLAVTAIGVIPKGQNVARRSGARSGDLVCVTGSIGAAAAGLAILERPALSSVTPLADALIVAVRRPTPRIDEGRALASIATAMMDCSDGLALDLSRLARASGIGIELDLDAIPIADGVPEIAAAVTTDAAIFAATGGDDYELIFAVPPDQLSIARRSIGTPVTPVGRVVPGAGNFVVLRNNRRVALETRGWEHRPGVVTTPGDADG